MDEDIIRAKCERILKVIQQEFPEASIAINRAVDWEELHTIGRPVPELLVKEEIIFTVRIAK